jgi:response regulator of citrate/malate metabolism
MDDKDNVLIVEDSPAIGILLKSYLEKLGYSQVYVCDTGASAIATFQDLASQDKHPIVLLDFMLPDIDARSVLTQLFEIEPSVRVILETASSKDDEGVKELIRLGVYHYLEKPIRFERLKEILAILEAESLILEDTSKQSDEKEDGYKIIDRQFNTYKRASVSRLVEQSQLSEKEVIVYVKKLESMGHIVVLDQIREISCDSCGSLKLAQIFQCPSCKSPKFEQTKLIEHFDCGNFSEESTYDDDICPKCKKQIKALGVDCVPNPPLIGLLPQLVC